MNAVTEELDRLPGVQAVAIELNAGHESRVTVTSSAPLREATVRTAVDEAGYELVGTAR